MKNYVSKANPKYMANCELWQVIDDVYTSFDSVKRKLEMSTVGPNIAEDTTSLGPNIGEDTTSLGPNIGEDTTSLGPNIGEYTTSLGPNIAEDTTSLGPNIAEYTTSPEPDENGMNERLLWSQDWLVEQDISTVT